MHVPPSEAARFPLPGWAYVPGVSLQVDHARLAPVKALVPTRFAGFVPAQHPALRYGLALNDAGFFWECHEILEAVWAAAPQGGRERILLRACIQVANGNLKLKMQRAHAAVRLYSEALAGLDELRVRRAVKIESSFADAFPTEALAESLRQTRDRSVAAAIVPVVFGMVPST